MRVYYDMHQEHPVPTDANDPKEDFFHRNTTVSEDATNCYAYAINIKGRSINPGDISGADKIAGFKDTDEVYNAACQSDDLIYAGDNFRLVNNSKPTVPCYLVARFTTVIDMHWRRIDSNDEWSEKLPNRKATRCEY